MLDHRIEAFLAHNHQLGLNMSPMLINAIEIGDLSGQVVHPALMYAAQLWGSAIFAKSHPTQVSNEAFYLKSAMDNLVRSVRTPTPLESLQTHLLLTAYARFRGDAKSCRDYMHMASEDIANNHLHIFDSNAPPVGQLGMEAEAVCCFLSYADNPLNVCYENPTLSVRLHEEFDGLMVRPMACENHRLLTES